MGADRGREPAGAPRMPDWVVARLAAIYALAYSGLMAAGAQELCDARVGRRGGDGLWCSAFVRQEQWVVLVVVPAVLAMLVIRLPRGGDLRLRAWLLLTLADVAFVCIGPSL